MTKRLILILLFLPILASRSFSQDSSDDIALRKMVTEYGQAKVEILFPGTIAVNELSGIVSVSSVREKSIEIVLSPLTVEWFIQQKYRYKILKRPDSKSIVMAANIKQAMEWESYPTYTQYDSILQSFAALYPSLCRVDTIGTSIYGKLVLAVKISDNVNVDEDEPAVFYSSTIHGDETGGFILMLHLADYLLKSYNTSGRVKNMVDNLEIWINPLANPDGTYGTGNTIYSPVRENANGYDLNRNFPDPETPNTVKQKETLDMMKFMRKHRFVLSANFHAGSEVVNYPWDRWSRLHADDEWFYNISRKYADTVHLNAVAGYMTFKNDGVTNGYEWYKINGGRQDFMTYELQGREVTIELDNNYITPAANLPALWLYNWHSLLGYLENGLYGIHGMVSDAITGEPVPARIFINGHDKDSSQIYSDTLSGSFLRLIASGTWDLIFTAAGYINKKVENVVVVNGQKTDLDVKMEKSADTVKTSVLIISPNPVSEMMTVKLPERQTGRVNVAIYNSLGMKIVDYYEDTIEDIPIVIYVRNLASGAYSLVITNKETGVSDKGRFVIIRR
jgi:hypothetical protein